MAWRRSHVRVLHLLAAVALIAVAALGCGGGGTSSSAGGGDATSTVGPYGASDVGAALSALRAQIGRDDRLLLMSVGQGVIDFDILAAGAGMPEGYSWIENQLVPQPSEFTPATGQTLADAAFPVALVDPAVPSALAARAAAVAGISGYHPTSMSLSRTLVGPDRFVLQWTVANTDDAAAPVLVARPDGSGYRRLS